MATFFDPSTIAGWFDDGQLLRAYLGDRSRHAVTAAGFGSSVATMLSEGNINLQVAQGGVSPGGTAADYVVATYTLPANAFDVAGRGISITAAGSFASNVNSKRVRIIFNPTAAVVGSTVSGGSIICDTGAITQSGGGWQLMASVFKYGAAGSNTQIGIHNQAIVSTAVAPVAPSLIGAVESNPILIAVTANAATAASDILFNFLEVNAMN